LFLILINNLRPGERGAPSCFQANRRSLGFGAPVSGKAPCIAPPAAFSRYKDAPSLAARPLLFLFPSHTGHPPRSCSGLRPSFTGHRRSSIAVSRLRMRHRHPRSRVTTGLRSLDRSRPSPFPDIAHPRQSLRASSIIVLSLTRTFTLSKIARCFYTLGFYSAQPEMVCA